jgi:hypothetical protein
VITSIGVFLAVAAASPPPSPSPSPSPITLTNERAQVSFALAGGALIDFHLADGDLNPFTWDPGAGEKPRPRGHFLCLDRWGAPTDAEKANGMPFHGEATHVVWSAEQTERGGVTMRATLPLAALTITRRARLHPTAAVVTVSETVTNQGMLGRVYNMVQHPTVGPPFLDPDTLVDASAGQGFAQGSPEPERGAVAWPRARAAGRAKAGAGRAAGGAVVDLRRLSDDPAPNVVSYVLPGELGWTTAAAPKRGLLVGYLWRTSEYPWLNMWRDVRDGKPHARGLEFGTTGLHQPPPILVAKGRLLDRPLIAYVDASASVTRSYVAFLLQIPSDFRGAGKVTYEGGALTLRERGSKRVFPIATGELLPPPER